MIIDDKNLVATVQRHEENIKSNQHRISKVEQDLESKTNRLEGKLDKLNAKADTHALKSNWGIDV